MATRMVPGMDAVWRMGYHEERVPDDCQTSYEIARDEMARAIGYGDYWDIPLAVREALASLLDRHVELVFSERIRRN